MCHNVLKRAGNFTASTQKPSNHDLSLCMYRMQAAGHWLGNTAEVLTW
jgi:hypothetical protein